MLIDKLIEDFYRVRDRVGIRPSVLWVSFECERNLEKEMEEKCGCKIDSGPKPVRFLGAEVKPTPLLHGVSWAFETHELLPRSVRS